MRLNRSDHARYDIAAPQQPADFRLETRPGTSRKFTQQPAIEACLDSQTFGDGRDTCPAATLNSGDSPGSEKVEP